MAINTYRKAIIIGASSGIGKALAEELSAHQIELGLAARRDQELHSLAKALGSPAVVRKIDISDADEARKQFDGLLQEMGSVDLVIISSGVGDINPSFSWDIEKNTIAVNILGVTAMIHASLDHFVKNKKGHLVVITSIAGLRGSAEGTSYHASKSFQSNYLEGLQVFVRKNHKHITITDIRPGLVDTAMAKGDGLFWVQPVQKAAQQIWLAIRKKKPVAYITKRWRLIAVIYKVLPGWIYCRL